MTVVRSKYAENKNHLYETEEWATEAVIRQLPPIQGLRGWECAAGNHKIADVLLKHGVSVFTSDIATYNRRHDAIFDFSDQTDRQNDQERFGVFDTIFTNPPFGHKNRLAVKFVERALERCDGWIVMLLTGKFDFGKTRLHLTRDNPRYWKKVVLYDRIRWFEGDKDGTEDHAWFIWAPIGTEIAAPITAFEGNPAKIMIAA